ncbi:SurA N-terminal domain-containing protein [Moraxella sp. ZJ142]|uniref:SurA N-terminal domain-containing protein n=1 Tax=Moraxella marmotae TaxID=3344520 RepID=UPI0035D42163
MRNFLNSWPGRLMLVGTLIPMAFLGTGTFGKASIQPNELIKVGEQVVDVSTFQAEVNAERNALLASGVDASLINEEVLIQLVLKRLTDKALLENQASVLGMTVSDEMISSLLQQYDIFQDNGQFSNDKFATYLQQNRLTKDALFHLERLRLSLRQLVTSIVGTAIYPNDQISRLIDLQLEAREVWVHRYTWQDYVDQVEISDAQIEEYFNKNQDKLLKPATVDLSYIELNPETLKVEEPTEDDINAQHAAYLKENGISDGRELAQILLTGADAAKKAEEVRKKLDAGESFEALAKQYSDDPSGANGGNIGTFKPAVFGDAAAKVEAALSGLTVGQTSQPVQSGFGYHIFKVTKVNDNAAALASVRDQMIDRASKFKRSQAFEDLSARINTMATDGMGVADIAKEIGVQVGRIDGYAQTDNRTPLAQPAVIAAAFDDFLIQDQSVSPNISLGDKNVWVQSSNYQPSRPLTLQEARPQIQQILAKQKAIELALADAKKQAEQAKTSGTASLTVPSANIGMITRITPLLSPLELASLFLHQSAEGNDVWAVQTEEGASVIVGGPVNKTQESQLSATDRQRAATVIRDNVGADQLEDYLRYLRDSTEVIINDKALQEQRH